MSALVEANTHGREEVAQCIPSWPSILWGGAVYSIGVETASARLALIVEPVRICLSSRRPCALITRLGPHEFAILCGAHGASDVAAAVSDGRLKLFTAVGDYAVNLFLHGATRYVRELDYFGLEEGSFVVVDEADDLFTPHDQVAVVSQAKTYQGWCKQHRHSMLLLHLRTSRYRPILDGNQAPAQYFDGVARVTSEPEGLRMRVDFWHSQTGCLTGTVMAVKPLSVPSSGLGLSAYERYEEKAKRRKGASWAPRRQRVWYLGPEDAALSESEHLIDWRVANSVEDILRSTGRRKRLNVLIGLGEDTHVKGLIDQVVAMRSCLGKEARLVLWESRYRLREHFEKQLLLRVGVDGVLSRRDALSSLPQLLAAPRTQASIDAPVPPSSIWEILKGMNAASESGWLPADHFVSEAQAALRHSAPLQVPCALAEMRFDGASKFDPAVRKTPRSSRTGDLLMAAEDVQFMFLRGCREQDVVQVVARRVCNDGSRLQGINFFTADVAISARLDDLRVEAGDLRTVGEKPAGSAASNVLALPQSTRAVLTHGHASSTTGLIVALAIGMFLWQPATQCWAQAGATRQDSARAVALDQGASVAYDEQRYADAGRLGLIQLQRDEGNHELRLKVANSLAWSGQYPEAIRQYKALQDTPMANAAALGLANVYLWNGRPELAEPLFRQVLVPNPNDPDARQGLVAAERHLRPRTALRTGWLDDSSNTERSTLGFAHRWRDNSLMQVFEVSTEFAREERVPDDPAINQRELAFAYEHLGMLLTPRVQVSAQESPTSKVFGSAGVKVSEGMLAIDVGHVNWGKLVFDPRALRDGLTANRAGAEIRADSGIGAWSGAYAYFAVSDGNRVQDLNVRYTPSWQPLPQNSGMRAFVGVYGHKADRKDPRYWSPESGFYTAYLGLSLDHSGGAGDIYAELKRSQRLGGEGASGWSGGFGGTYRLSGDWAIRGEAFYLDTRRDESVYRSKSATISLERLW